MVYLYTLRLPGLISTALFLLTFLSCGSQSKIQDSEQTSEYKKTSKEILVETNKTTYRVADYTADRNLGEYKQAILAGGCFWCTEAAFERIEGVVDVISGYAGGHTAHPTYGDVGRGITCLLYTSPSPRDRG